MKMKTNLIVCLYSLFVLIPLVSSSLLVQLSNFTSMDSFFVKYPSIYNDISKVYQFGTFQGFAGNFDLKTVQLLQKLKSEVLIKMKKKLKILLRICGWHSFFIGYIDDSRRKDSCKWYCWTGACTEASCSHFTKTAVELGRWEFK